MRVASAPVSWGVIEHSGAADPSSYRRVLREIAQAGYAGTELGPYGFLPTDPRTLRAELARHDLDLVSAFVALPLPDGAAMKAGLDHLRQAARLLRQLGVPRLVLSDSETARRDALAGRVTEVDGLSEAQWEIVGRSVTQVVGACAALGLDVALHPHVGCHIETPAEVARCFRQTTDVDLGLCLDTGHCTYGGGDPCEEVRRYGARIRHIHLKDIDPAVLRQARDEGWSFPEAVRRGVFTVLGKGCVDFPTFFDRLREIQYQGWLVVEQDIDPQLAGREGSPAFEWSQASRRYLRELGL